MGIVDSSKLPTGNRARAAFIAALEASDDRVERHYLELKSGFDLTSKADRRKVVKFILGASHRDPAKAARHFNGYAVMVLGLTRDGVAGVPKFELMDLERDIDTFAGTDPPGWDVDLVPASGGRDYVIVIVDPPDDKIRPVLQSSDALQSGDVYIRVEGATRRATGPELVAMMRRAQGQGQGPVLDVSVEPSGILQSLVIDVSELRNLIDWHRDHFEAQLEDTAPRSPFPVLQGSFSSDRRSHQEFLDAVERWRDEALDEPESGLHDLASQMSRPFLLKISNNKMTSLKEVRLELTFDAPVTALYWREQDNTFDLYADRPKSWGTDSYLTPSLSGLRPLVAPHAFEGAIRIATQRPAELVVEMRRLHSEQSLSTPDDDVVLVLFADGPDAIPDTVTATWRLTAGEVNEVLRGSFEMDMSWGDWRGPLHSTIARLRGDASEECR
ncbi:hypothetical protein [Microbacterium sp. NPDC089696]|uniref:hypothetical protein n=1 Tax=Microbacterium sp. NPDC089696 TaxID=3364199 RepID=UPI003801004E